MTLLMSPLYLKPFSEAKTNFADVAPTTSDIEQKGGLLSPSLQRLVVLMRYYWRSIDGWNDDPKVWSFSNWILKFEGVLLSDGIPASNKTSIEVCPPHHDGKGRTLVLLFDGTGDTDDDDVTNVIEIRNMLYGYSTYDPDKQLVFYQNGIGTYNPYLPTTKVHLPTTKVHLPVVGSVSRLVDKAIAWSLRHHVIDGYEWIVENYHDGDRICMFGFSRGAYTARALSGMLSKVGLLPLAHKKACKDAFQSYKQMGNEGMKHSRAFKKRMGCSNVIVEFLGAWDTVNSVGLVTAKTLPFTAFNRTVKTFRHAVSLDERRARFRSNMWAQPKEKARHGPQQNGQVPGGGIDTGHPEEIRPSDQQEVDNQKPSTLSIVSVPAQGAKDIEKDDDQTVDPRLSAEDNLTEQQKADARSSFTPSAFFIKPDVDQVWFSGCHCDVGGGSVLNGTRPNLSHIPLRWMVRECFKANTGIMFYTDKLSAIGLNPDTLYPTVQRRPEGIIPTQEHKFQHKPATKAKRRKFSIPCLTGSSAVVTPDTSIYSTYSEEELDLYDSLAPVFDQLVVKRKNWWPIEKYPMKVWSMAENKYVRRKNDGRGRSIMEPLEPLATFRGELVDPRWCKIRIHRSVKTRMECEGRDGSRYIPSALLNGKSLDEVEQSVIEWVD